MNTYLHYIPHTTQHWFIVVVLSAVLFGLLLISMFLRNRLNIAAEYSRKFVHISVGVALASTPLLIEPLQPLFFIAIVFTIINFVSIKKGFFSSIHDARESYGTVYYPLVIALAAALFWETNQTIFIATTLVLSLGDAGAALVGTRSKKPIFYSVWNDTKSVQGSAAMFFISFFVFAIALYLAGDTLYVNSLLAAFTCALPVTIAEAISKKGSDNISVALTSMVFLWLFYTADGEIQQRFVYANILALGFATGAYYSRTLKIDGAIAAYVMAVFVFGSGGLTLALPILAFFVSSSLLSQLKRQHKKRTLPQFEKSSERDAGQVFANGGLATIAALIYLFLPTQTVFQVYLVVLAAANADTWATEIGVLSLSRPRLITTWEKAAKGQSGAVSLLGLIAAAGGSLFIIIAGAFWLQEPSLSALFILGICGFAGSIIDSILGATVQAQYRLPDGSLTEKTQRAGRKLALARGHASFNNDMVNFFAGVSAILLFLLLDILI